MTDEERERLRHRSTADLIILILATFVGLTVTLAAAALFATELLQPEKDTTTAVIALSNVVTGAVNVILGAIAGFVAGRGSAEKAPAPSPER